MVRLGTVGSGWIVKSFLGGTKYVDGLTLAAVYSRSGERAQQFASETGAPAYFTDLRQMAQSNEIDAVYIDVYKRQSSPAGPACCSKRSRRTRPAMWTARAAAPVRCASGSGVPPSA